MSECCQIHETQPAYSFCVFTCPDLPQKPAPVTHMQLQLPCSVVPYFRPVPFCYLDRCSIPLPSALFHEIATTCRLQVLTNSCRDLQIRNLYTAWFCSGTHSTNTFTSYNQDELTVSDQIHCNGKNFALFLRQHVHRPHTAHFVVDIMLWEAQKCSNHPILNIAGTLLPRPNRELHGQVEIM